MLFFIKILQAALVSTFAINDPELAAPEPDDEATEESSERQYRVPCTMSGNTPTGREWGEVWQTNDPETCARARIGGTAPLHYPSCHSVAREQLNCIRVITI